MPDNEDARPGAGSGTGAQTAGEHVPDSVTDLTDFAGVRNVLRRGGDPVRTHRRACRAFDRWALDYYGDEACAQYGITSAARAPEPYAAGGMTLDFAARELAA